MKLFVALAATALALVVAGCAGGDGDDDQAVEARLPPKLVDTAAVRGGTRRERALLQRAVRDMEETTLTRISIAPVEDGGGADVAIAFTPARPATTVRQQWDEWIVAGAFSRRLFAAGLPARVSGSGVAGDFTARPKLPRKPDPQPLSAAEQATVVRRIRAAAERSGAERVRVDVHRPFGVAVAVSLSVRDPARYLKGKLRPLLTALERHRPQLEGMYLGVLDSRRRLALEWGSWTRNPAGSYWVRPDLANCSPIRQSPPPGADEPPDCPA